MNKDYEEEKGSDRNSRTFCVEMCIRDSIIVVGVVLETVKQIESQLLVRNYKGFLAN